MDIERCEFIPAVMSETGSGIEPCFEYDYIGDGGIDMRRLFEVEQEVVDIDYGYIPEDYRLWSRSDYEQMKKEGDRDWLEVLGVFEDPTVEWVVTDEDSVHSVYNEKFPRSIDINDVELTYIDDVSTLLGEYAYDRINRKGLSRDLFTDDVKFYGDKMRELAEWLLDKNEVSLPLFIQSIEKESGGKKLNWLLKEEMARSLENEESLRQEIETLSPQEAYEKFNTAKEKWLPQVPLRVEVDKHIKKSKGRGL